MRDRCRGTPAIAGTPSSGASRVALARRGWTSWSVSRAPRDTARGGPGAVNTPIIGYWDVGDRESETGGNSLTKTNIEEGVLVRIYRPGSVRATSLDDSLEVWVRSAVRACKAALWGDVYLDGNSIGLSITDTVAAWENVANVLCRTATFTVWVDQAFVDDITV